MLPINIGIAGCLGKMGKELIKEIISDTRLNFIGGFEHPDHKNIRIFPYNNVDNAFNTARDNAGLGRDITLHSLRHHFCSKALESGMSLHCVKDLAGHASITTTEIYLHTNHKLRFEQYQMFEQLMMTEIN